MHLLVRNSEAGMMIRDCQSRSAGVCSHNYLVHFLISHITIYVQLATPISLRKASDFLATNVYWQRKVHRICSSISHESKLSVQSTGWWWSLSQYRKVSSPFLSTLLTMGALLFVDKFIHPIYEVVILPSNMFLFFSQLHDVMKAPLVVVARQHQFKVLQLREQYIWHFVHEVLKLQH